MTTSLWRRMLDRSSLSGPGIPDELLVIADKKFYAYRAYKCENLSGDMTPGDEAGAAFQNF